VYFTDNRVTISGTPSGVGTFEYTVTSTGGNGFVEVKGTITVDTAAPTFTLTSAVGTDNKQTVVHRANMQPIVYYAGNMTNAVVTGLPKGVRGVFIISQVTISGAPSEVGTFYYTVTSVGGNGLTTKTGAIHVIGNTITLTSADGTDKQTVAIGGEITPITYRYAGPVGVLAIVSDLPAGLSCTIPAIPPGTIKIQGKPIATGEYEVTVMSSAPSVTVVGKVTVVRKV
jgi:hypothetical protein